MTDLERAREILEGYPLETAQYVIADALAAARDEALEEAAHECDEEAKGSSGEMTFRDGCETCAAAIRLLKEKRDGNAR